MLLRKFIRPVLHILDYTEKDENWFQNQRLQHLYLSYSWLKTIATTYGIQTKLLLEDDDLITAFCVINNLTGNRIVSLPFSDYTPVDNKERITIQELFSYLKEEYPNYAIVIKSLSNEHIQVEAEVSRKAVYHVINLEENYQEKQHKSFKRGVKKALASQVKINISNTHKSLDDFYRLYKKLRFEKFKSIPQPFSFFKNTYSHFIAKNKGFIIEANLENKVVASAIILFHQKTAYYKFGCSDQEYLSHKPNNLLFHTLLDEIKGRNLASLDLGLSGVSDAYAGLRRWKSQMGGEARDIIYWKDTSMISPYKKQELQKANEFLKSLTSGIVQANLDEKQTSALSEKLYPLFA